MKISNINNNLSSLKSPAFGYDKKANDELRLKLINHRDNENKEWGETLLNLQWHCNTLEDKIRLLEKKAVKDEALSHKIHDYEDLFLSSKEALCAYVVDTFPESDFADKEFTHYKHQLCLNKYKIFCESNFVLSRKNTYKAPNPNQLRLYVFQSTLKLFFYIFHLAN